jgi:tRNA (adenine58-N1)-methyltransferase non-catalytic subunit
MAAVVDSSAVIRPGDSVILVTSDDHRFFVKAERNETVRLGKKHVNVGAIIGSSYGDIFEIGVRKLVYLPGALYLKRSEVSSAALAEDAATTHDNRNLTDAGSSHQKLQPQDIAEMRTSGASGEQIIEALVKNSSTWESKTQFSQQKWLARKEQKYAPRLRVVRCDATEVCESYFQKHRDKVGSLRPDTLAQILAFSNVSAGATAVVFDTCMGVVVSAVAERLGGRGRILAPFAGTHPAADALRNVNFDDATESSVVFFHTSEMGKLESTRGEPLPVEDTAESREARVQEMLNTVPPFLAKKLAAFKSDSKGEAEKKAFLEKREGRIRRQCQKRDPAAIRHWLREQSDSLVIAAPGFDVTEILLKLWPTLAPAAPFVIFSEYVEPLVQVCVW